jgi:hypothetical protein
MAAEQASEIEATATLEARIIRACRTHKECPLDCKERQVEELGVVARIDKESDQT